MYIAVSYGMETLIYMISCFSRATDLRRTVSLTWEEAKETIVTSQEAQRTLPRVSLLKVES